MDYLNINTLGSGITYGLSSGLTMTTDLTYGIGSTIGYGLNSGLTMTTDLGTGIGSMIGLGYSPPQDDSDSEYIHEEITKKDYVKKGRTITYNGVRSTELKSNEKLNNLLQKG